MAKAKKPRPTDGGGNWMDTYGDMVTLLLTFFIMLYAMSSVDQKKWEVFVSSLSPEAGKQAEEIVINSPVGADGSGQELTGNTKLPEMELMDTDTLYLVLSQKMDEMGIDGVTVSRGEDYTFVEFQDKAFFNGDSSVLTEQGQQVMEVFCQTIAPVSSSIGQINIMAHTAQGDPNKPNNPRTDRMLSAMRAAEVCIFIQGSNVIEPEKLVNISYGQFRPIATNNTREGREKNRRVELLLIDEGADVRSMNEYYEEYQSGVNEDTTITTDGIVGNEAGFVPADPSTEGVASAVYGETEPVESAAAPVEPSEN